MYSGSECSWHDFKQCLCHFVVLFTVSEGTSSSADFLMSESWEWREGRLLAYELILKFLITNHIHYVFPAFVLPVSKAAATSTSVDESLISRWVSL